MYDQSNGVLDALHVQQRVLLRLHRSWVTSTPETRERGRLFDKALKDEETASGWVDPE